MRRLLLGQLESQRVLKFSEGDLVEKKASQIAYCITQASEFYKAADSITINTSPLLYFYGMLALAKALIVANHPDLLLEDVNYHGFTTRPISSELKAYVDNKESWAIEREYAVVREGVFKSLTRIVQNFEFEENAVLYLKDILAVDPEICEMYRRHFGEAPAVQYLYDYKEQLDPYQLEICPQTKDKLAFETAFPMFAHDFEVESEVRHNTALVYHSKLHVKNFPDYMGIYYPIPGGRYLVRGPKTGSKPVEQVKYQFPELSDYVLMFILSSVVRYKQEFWGKVVRGEIDGTLGLINLAMGNCRMRFPNFILNNLFNERFEYGIAGRYM